MIVDRKLDLKIISAGNTEYTSVRLLSDEDDSQTGRVFIAIIVSRHSFVIIILIDNILNIWGHTTKKIHLDDED